MLKSKTKGYISAIFATVFMASLGIFVKNLNIQPTIITLFRLFFSAVFMIIVIAANKRLNALKVGSLKNLFLSGVALSTSIIFYIAAIQRTSMSNAVILLYLGPIFASIAAFVFLKEDFKGIDLISFLLSVLGILFVLKFSISFNSADMYGNMYGLLSGFAYGMLIFANRTIKNDIDLDVRSFYQFLFGSLIILPIALSRFDLHYIISNMFLLVTMAFICGFAGITLMFNAIKRLPAVEYGILSYLEVFFATLFGVVIFNDNMDILKIIGGALIILSGLLQIIKNNLQRRMYT